MVTVSLLKPPDLRRGVKSRDPMLKLTVGLLHPCCNKCNLLPVPLPSALMYSGKPRILPCVTMNVITALQFPVLLCGL